MNTKSTISAIVAMSRNGVIGRDGKIPWHLPGDLKRFRALTMNHPVIMGRRTFESLSNLLFGRNTIICSRSVLNSPQHGDPNTSIIQVGSIDEAIETACDPNWGFDTSEVFIAGGEQIYRATHELWDRIYLTMLFEDIENGDAIFPTKLLKVDDWTWNNERCCREASSGPYEYVTWNLERDR